MDVRCSRCGTEYDFDDALVSERGTTVKCTNCGHQFKVFPGGAGGVPERWIVRKGSGRELVYTSLRDLQRAIAQRQVGPQDLLSRGGGQPLRALAAIAELEPFFHAQGPTPGANEQVQRTLLAMSPGGGAYTEDTVRDNPLFPDAQAQAEINRNRPTPAGGIAARKPDAPVRPGPAAAPEQPRQRFEDIEPKTLPRNQAPEPDAPPVATMSSEKVAINSGESPGQVPSGPDGMTNAFRTYQDSFSDESLPSFARPPRKSALRWIVGLVLVGAVAFVAGTVGVRYVKQLGAGPAPTARPEDERVKKLLAQGGEDLARGDFESAKEQLDKASVLAEKDPGVLTALAHLEATRADQHWLALKVLPLTSKMDRDTEEAELSRRLPRVRKAAEDATLAAPNDGAALRTRIDALRLGGEVNQARDLVGSLGDVSSQPETAYVLAALDLGEASPAWPSVIDRLRSAAAADRGASRARAALV
ncbi:MAG TPA: zinc-ribbon domain-containing protein, partial [Polyangiaceae bacterium]